MNRRIKNTYDREDIIRIFKFNENTEMFEVEINGIRFVCEELFDRCEEIATRLSECYYEKLPHIVEFMLSEGIQGYFGKLSAEAIIENLKTPEIDVDRCELAYLEHTLDSVHIIQITFSPTGLFDELWEMNVNG